MRSDMRSARVCAVLATGLLLAAAACSRSNNLLFGRVEATVGTHQVVVTDCYRTHVPPPTRTADSVWQFTPCRDADVLIKDEELWVNGHSYGRLNSRDSVLVDHSVVSIKRAS